jgi:hypothetical protein
MSDFVVQRGSPKIIIDSQGQGLGITLGAPQTLLTRALLWLSTGLTTIIDNLCDSIRFVLIKIMR